MLGLILAASNVADKVITTETTEVMQNLQQNVDNNTCHDSDNSKTESTRCCSPSMISVRRLRWDNYRKDIETCQSERSSEFDPHSFDTIVGTDVIFSMALVKPLLKTMKKFSKPTTDIFLCVQVRCEDSHDYFMKKAPKYGFSLKECSYDSKNLLWGLDLDCKLLHLRLQENIAEKKRKLDDYTMSKSNQGRGKKNKR